MVFKFAPVLFVIVASFSLAVSLKCYVGTAKEPTECSASLNLCSYGEANGKRVAMGCIAAVPAIGIEAGKCTGVDTAKVCYCNTDGCNGINGIKPSVFAVVAGALVAMVWRY